MTAIEEGYCPDSSYMIDTVRKYQRELALLLSGSPIRRYQAGEVVFTQGETGHRFYFIKKGRVMITICGGDGAEKIMSIHDSNTFVGDTSLDQYPYAATAVTLQESELYVIERTHFEFCVKSYPEVAFMILESVIRKARNALLQVGDLSLRNARGRVAHTLIKLSDEIGTETDDGIVIQKKITHETLAGLTGLARPTLTSVLNDLERSNVITKRNHHIIIIDKKRLSNMVDNILD